jgi:hypothetical protein
VIATGYERQIPPFSQRAHAHALKGWRLGLRIGIKMAAAQLVGYVAMQADDLVQKQFNRSSPKTREGLAA